FRPRFTRPLLPRDESKDAPMPTPNEVTRGQADFLAYASKSLALSLDFEATLRKVADLAVEKLADWCAVHIAEQDSTLSQVLIAHRDPARVERAWELARRYPYIPNTASGITNVLR